MPLILNESPKTLKKWLKWIIVSIASIRIMGWLLGFSFFCGYAEVWFWLLLILTTLLFWGLHLQKSGSRITLVICSVLGIYPMYLILLFFTWINYGSWEKEDFEYFKNLDHPVTMVYTNRADDFDVMDLKITLVEPRFGGFINQEYGSFETPFDMDDMKSYAWLGKKYVLPKAVKDDHMVVYWKERRLLFDLFTSTCYELESR